jgi:3'-5' exoribonuclease
VAAETAPSPTVAELTAGQSFTGAYAVARKDRLTGRTGQPYLSLTLRDRSGEVPARVFGDADGLGARFERGDAVAVRARAATFRGELVVEVDDLRRIDPEQVDPARFLPSAYRDAEELMGFFEHLATEVHDPGLRAVVETVVGTEPVATGLRRAPCSRGGHHAYLGGLLEHTVAVGTLVLETCQLHRRLDSDLLMAAALLHDIGRTREFTYGAEFGSTEEGRLLGHLQLGAEIVGPVAAELAPERRTELLHCVLSHHGVEGGRGFGSAEALALQRINALDAGVKGALEQGLERFSRG